MSFNSWLEKVYGEEDFSRNVAITLSGSVGLACYILFADSVIAFFGLVITFPLFRLLANSIHKTWETARIKKARSKDLKTAFSRFSTEETDVLKQFVKHGGCVLSFSTIRRQNIYLPDTGVRSLIQRGILENTSLPPDYITEGLVLDEEIFNKAMDLYSEIKTPNQ